MARAQDSVTSEPQLADGDTTIIVTAQKRSENINQVGMSINAVAGEQLVKLGVSGPEQLAKIIPNFVVNETLFAVPVYTIRGIGFQETSLAASPAVSVYTDEAPVPFQIETVGVGFDVERVEVLKGPQGTLYGQNSTGGAVNYIANKPSDTFTAGARGSFSRFTTGELEAFVSGPLGSTLSGRVAVRAVRSDDWQKSVTRDDTLGSQNLLQGRVILQWEPTGPFTAMLTAQGFIDKSETPAPQLIAASSFTPGVPLPPALAQYPRPGKHARLADWTPGDYRRDNKFGGLSLRLDYDASDNVTLTSLSTLQSYKRFQPVESDGTSLIDQQSLNTGDIDTFAQELRVAGEIGASGHWVIGGNYEHDKVFDDNQNTFTDSTVNPFLGFFPLNQVSARSRQSIDSYAIFASGDYRLTNTLKLNAGGRYTKQDRSFAGCAVGPASGPFAGQGELVGAVLSQFATGVPIAPGAPGTCITSNQTLTPGLVERDLKEDNISWRIGLDWQPRQSTLLYANVSRGYKSGSFPNLIGFTFDQYMPVVQESVLAYEAGFKSTLAERTLQLNGAVFYYDYQNKQLRGRILTGLGPLEGLVNVPKSHLYGAELEATWRPAHGLRISPSVGYIHSRIDGSFTNFGPDGQPGNFTGEPFPYTPKWTAKTDAEYSFPVGSGLEAFVGGNLSYQSKMNAGLGQYAILDIDPYAIIDVRAGVGEPGGRWSASVWGRNITNKYYTVAKYYAVDTTLAQAGRPVTYGITLSYRWE
jgi:iron complex outermembrane recepter protein